MALSMICLGVMIRRLTSCCPTLFLSVLLACCSPPSSSPVDGGNDASEDVGPSDGDAVSDADADRDTDDGSTPHWGARLQGTVWGPGGHFPVAGALVAALVDPPEDIPEGTFCERCVVLPPGVPNTTSAADGTFSLEVPAGGTYFLVVQKGQFRRVTEYEAPIEVGDHVLDAELTTLPNRRDQEAGLMIPRIALVYGDYDAIQDVLAKAGLGDTDGAYGLEWGTEEGIFDVYDNHGAGGERHGEPRRNLIRDLDRMLQYHIIFFACSYNANFSFMEDEEVQNNVREYVRRGGKLYVSDYAYAVIDMVWPEFLWFTDPLHGGCVENRFPDGCNHGPPFDAPSRTLDSELSEWLLAVAPEDVTGTPPAAELETLENWDTIGEIFEGYVGDDPDTGEPVHRVPTVWVEGTWNYEPDDAPDDFDRETYHPFTVSWPFGCGRALYTTYHTVGSTTGNRHPGFLPQELVLWHLIMELQVCQEDFLI